MRGSKLFSLSLFSPNSSEGVDFDIAGNLSSSPSNPDHVTRSGLVGKYMCCTKSIKLVVGIFM